MCGVVLAAMAGHVRAGLILSPQTIIRNDFGGGSPFFIENTINQAALSPGSSFISGVDDFSTYIAGNPTHLSNNDSSGDAWFGDFALSSYSGFIDFDLGSVYTIERLAFFSNPFRAFTSVSVQTSNDATFSVFAAVGSFVPFYNNDANTSAPVQDIDLTDTSARYVRFDIAGFNSLYPSMGEVAFDVNSGVAAVPEPSSLAMFGIGAGVMGLVSIRRRRREQKQAATA